MLYVYGKIEDSTVNGPGHRAVVWFSGCTLNCENCWNPETHKRGGGEEIAVEELGKWLLSIPNIEGVTFSGGEPLQQATELRSLMNSVHSKRKKFSFGMFTGYTFNELEQGKFKIFYKDKRGTTYENYFEGFYPGSISSWKSIRGYLDFAIMGRYNKDKHSSTLSMRGSSNQEVKLFSDRYSLEDFRQQEAEIIITPDAKLIMLTGFPTAKIVEKITNDRST